MPFNFKLQYLQMIFTGKVRLASRNVDVLSAADRIQKLFKDIPPYYLESIQLEKYFNEEFYFNSRNWFQFPEQCVNLF